ncbi:tyrosinase family protein [Olivibacter jilunii]|uniref:tyrosinase family protein n=1 Tax=Olivibacter jilunii TaxID=985016 RepID=UPI001030F2D8|nr:tyrosinase family protein [Olivibacter jilunii]
MILEFAINGKKQGPFYVGYTPAQCTLRLSDGVPGGLPVTIVLSNNDPLTGGQLVFYPNLSSPVSETLTLQVPGDGATVSYYIAGKPDVPSTQYNDAAINFKHNDQSVRIIKFTVRVRKNANSLTTIERDKFLNAFVNVLLSGNYQSFLDMHNEAANSQIHNRAAFLPWHRMYLLDLERHLHEFDKSVMIPYWDFQSPAPNVFTLDFMGVPTSSTVGELQFSVNNPLNNWYINNLPPLARIPRFNAQQSRANVEARSTTLGRLPGFRQFASMEGNPHGSAHTSFTGPVNFAPTAPRDPLFFMIHANVDRIWAEWQSLGTGNTLYDSTNINAYSPETNRSPNPRIGDYLDDTMWPWNGVTGGDRPPTAPGGPFIASVFTNYPGPTPKVIDTIDYQGRLTNKSLYFDYDAIHFVNTVVPQNISAMSTEKAGAAESLKADIKKAKDQNRRALESFVKSTDTNDLMAFLNNMDMLTDPESIKKAIEILRNRKNETGIRVSALVKLLEAISLDENLIKYVLSLLTDKREPLDLRKEALRTIETMSFTSPVFPALQPEIIQAFRGLINDYDHEIRRDAIAYLAKSNDEFLQRTLINGLQNHEEAVVSEEMAVHFLGYDIHAGIYPLLQKIVKTSSNDNSRAEALYLLAGDPQAKELLRSVFSDRNELFDVRKNSLLALKQQSPEDFLELAQKAVLDSDESENIRAISFNVLSHYWAVSGKPDEKFLDQVKKDLPSLPKELAAGITSFLENRDEEPER